jgi:hypothetical protein
MQKTIRFLIATLMLFFERTNPDSKHTKPPCITITMAEQSMIQVISEVDAFNRPGSCKVQLDRLLAKNSVGFEHRARFQLGGNLFRVVGETGLDFDSNAIFDDSTRRFDPRAMQLRHLLFHGFW